MVSVVVASSLFVCDLCYAMKCVASNRVISSCFLSHHMIRPPFTSQDYMQECDSPFLVRLHGTNQDDQTLYMLMEAVMGGELFAYLNVS